MNHVLTHPSTSSLAAPGTVPRILVVDDEQHMCDVCTRILQRGGYQVVATSDPTVALQVLRGEQRFDLLLTDIKMPAISGLDLARLARERDPAIAIIIMTGFASIEYLHQSVQRGAADFIFKPFELEHLRLAVDQALHKRSILQDNLRLRALEHLFESSRALSTTLELSELAHILLRVTTQQSGCRCGFLLLAEENGVLTSTIPSTSNSQILEAGLQLAQHALFERQPLHGDSSSYCRFDEGELHRALAVPLRAQGDINGILLLCDDGPDTLRPGVQEEIALLANHAGAALRNAYLYRQLGDAYQRLQELDRLKSEIIALASHELRTPLSMVLGYTTMVRDQSEGERRDYLQRVLDNAQRIKDIVDDMINLRHLETGEAQLDLRPVMVQELVTLALERLRSSLTQRPREMRIDLPDDAIVFLSDQEKVILILGHLLTNAIKFTPEGGRISIRATLQPVNYLNQVTSRVMHKSRLATQSLPWVVFEIEDTGIGIPDHEQARIFERFYQVADSLTRNHGGTGLGLAIVRELVVALDGVIWLTSSEGQGSTFFCALPYRQEQPISGE